ncbi:MAG: cobyric acid synthase CobQ, partial [Methanosarcinales archaeon]|nr:cobyric acid synthase CobQ [Methanosarcinales archaeon]
EAQARVRYVGIDDKLGTPDLIILPGTGMPLKDLEALRESGMADQILNAAGKTPIIGISEGYQMLGKTLTGPDGKVVNGFGLLDVETVYEKEDGYSEKPVRVSLKVKGCSPYLKVIEGETIEGFNVYSGKVSTKTPVFENDGACSADGTVVGTSMHGFFDNKNLRVALLKYLAEKKGVPYVEEDNFTMQDGFEELAQVFEKNIDVETIYKIMGLK